MTRPVLDLAPGVRPRVVVVGSGHGGLECVLALESAAVDVLLIDRNNFHTFQPLLYQVATAGLDVNDITQPIRHIVRSQANADVRLGTVVGADFDARTVALADGETIPYDVLVLAPGASTAYFGVEGAEEYGYPLKSVEDAVALRSHVLRQFEAVAAHPGRIEDGALTIVVVGGGPTGVEMSGALRELFAVLAKDFPTVDVDRAHVVLVDGDRLPLSGYDPTLREYTRQTLERKDAEVRLGVNVERVEVGGVVLADGQRIQAETVLWAAGIRAHPLADALGLEQTRGARIVVDATLRVPGQYRVFVVGDAAGATDAEGALYPQVAQVAIQQGTHAAKLIEAMDSGDHAVLGEPFVYDDLGQMATIGRNAAVLQLPSGFKLTGFLAWVGWLLVHLVSLVGFRNRASVFGNWVYNYFTYDRGPRLILEAERTNGGQGDTSPPVAPSLVLGRGGAGRPTRT